MSLSTPSSSPSSSTTSSNNGRRGPTSSSSSPPSAYSSSGYKTPNSISFYKFESERLETFDSWPRDAKVDAGKIAKAGFYHTGRQTEVECAWCRIKIISWNYGDQVMAKHRAASPECPFINNTSDNVPIINSSITTSSNSSSENQSNTNESTMDVVDSPPNQESEPSSSAPSLLRPRSYSPERSERYKSEANRLETFVNWPLSYINPTDLAKTGFIYTGRDDSVRCVFCGEYVGQWDRSDIPECEHEKFFPHCPFIRGHDVGNIPIGNSHNNGESNRPLSSSSIGRSSTSTNSSDAPLLGRDEVGHRNRGRDSVASSSSSSSGNVTRNIAIMQGKHLNAKDETIGIIRHTGPSHPKYSTFESRLRTFGDWPPALKQRPKEFAEAGFYYIGLSDQVKCFSCDGGLRNWQSDDDPWTEHARWFANCGFVRLVKGDEFILQCIREKPTDPLNNTENENFLAVDEEQLKAYMSSEIVNKVLSMGIDPSRIKIALKKKLSVTGSGFESTSQLMDAAFGVQREQEERVQIENNPSSSAFDRQQSLPVGAAALTLATASRDVTNSSSSSTNLTLTESSTPSSISIQGGVNKLNISNDKESSSSKSNSLSTSINKPLSDSASVTQDLEMENRILKEQRTCKICMDNEIGIVFLPCGHLICCVQCTVALKDCPLCRLPIQGTVKTYMS